MPSDWPKRAAAILERLKINKGVDDSLKKLWAMEQVEVVRILKIGFDEGERKGIERAAKVASDIESGRVTHSIMTVAGAIRNLEVGKE